MSRVPKSLIFGVKTWAILWSLFVSKMLKLSKFVIQNSEAAAAAYEDRGRRRKMCSWWMFLYSQSPKMTHFFSLCWATVIEVGIFGQNSNSGDKLLCMKLSGFVLPNWNQNGYITLRKCKQVGRILSSLKTLDFSSGDFQIPKLLFRLQNIFISNWILKHLGWISFLKQGWRIFGSYLSSEFHIFMIQTFAKSWIPDLKFFTLWRPIFAPKFPPLLKDSKFNSPRSCWTMGKKQNFSAQDKNRSLKSTPKRIMTLNNIL